MSANNVRDPSDGASDEVGPSHAIHSRGTIAITAPLNIPPPELDETPRVEEQQIHIAEAGGVAQVVLQPVDEGFGAWSYVGSAFAMYIVVWGFPNAFPILQTYLSSGPTAQFPNSMILPLLAPGIQDIEEGLLFPLLPRFARHRKAMVMLGVFIIVASTILTSYADSATTIVLLQGVVFGLGGILLNFVHVSAFSEWFDKKQSQAMSIIWLGYRFGALGWPLICQGLLEKLDFGQTLRVLVSVMLVLLLPSVLLLRGRYPASAISSKSAEPQVSKVGLLANRDVLFYLFCTLLFATQMYIPLIFITKIGADLGLSGSEQAFAQTLLTLALMLGTYITGAVSNEGFRPPLLVLAAMSSATLHSLVLGFSKSKPLLFTWALGIGLASGGWSNSLVPFYKEASSSNQAVFTAVHSLFSLVRGIACLTNGPIGTALVRLGPPIDLEAFAIGKYRYLVIYAASMPFLSGLSIMLRFWSKA